MKVAVVGGKLQGVEAVYLARQAGWQVSLIDKDPHVPARGIAHSFIQSDVMKNAADMFAVFREMDLVIPALENRKALKYLKDLAERKGYPLALDDSAFAVTSSKQKSDALFINDCSLYLHAGSSFKFLEYIRSSPTSVVNGYFGRFFSKSSISIQERTGMKFLMRNCDRLIRLS